MSNDFLQDFFNLKYALGKQQQLEVYAKKAGRHIFIPLQLKPNRMKNWTTKIPHLYFIGIILLLYFGNLGAADSTPMVLLFILPFAIQLRYNKNWLNLVLASITGFYSFWMVMAYLSDLAKPATESTASFALLGGLIVVLNFVMIYLLFKTCLQRQQHIEYQNWQVD